MTQSNALAMLCSAQTGNCESAQNRDNRYDLPPALLQLCHSLHCWLPSKSLTTKTLLLMWIILQRLVVTHIFHFCDLSLSP